MRTCEVKRSTSTCANRKMIKKIRFLIFCCFFIIYNGKKIFSDAGITNSPGPTDACDGSSVLLNWTYDNVADLFFASWNKNTEQLVVKTGTGNGNVAAAYQNKIEYVSNGAINLLNANLSDSGTYKFSVTYIAATGLPSAESTSVLRVLDPPAVPTGYYTGSGSSRTCVCSTTHLGTPNVDVQVKVEGILKADATAQVPSGQSAKCCVVGDAVTCLTANTDGDTEHCVAVGTTTTTTTATTTTTTTTTITATTITSPTTNMSTSSTIATTTSSMLTTTTSITAPPTASSTVSSTSSTVKAPLTSRDKALVTMIIVVSVIGGVLIVAIFSIIFVMMHRKSCFTRNGHSKQYAQRSYHRKQHRQAENNASGRFSTTQQNHAMRGYYFYNGTQK